MVKSGIYVIVSSNRRVYIGSSKDVEKRRKDHFYNLEKGTHHCIALQRAYDKYGILHFSFVFIEPCSIDNLLIREQFWIDYHHFLFARMFNGSKVAGRVVPNDEIRRKMSISAKNKPPVSEETRRKLSESGKGRKLSERHLEVLRNRTISDAERQNRSNSQKGRVVTDEARLKIRNSLSGRRLSPETIAKLRTKSVNGFPPGSKHSEETKLKMRRKRGPLSPEGLARNQMGARKRADAARAKREAENK